MASNREPVARPTTQVFVGSAAVVGVERSGRAAEEPVDVHVERERVESRLLPRFLPMVRPGNSRMILCLGRNSPMDTWPPLTRITRNARQRGSKSVAILHKLVADAGIVPQRARPLRCAAAPPNSNHRKVGRGGFRKRPRTASAISVAKSRPLVCG